jgi:salicylate hydroxylase
MLFPLLCPLLPNGLIEWTEIDANGMHRLTRLLGEVSTVSKWKLMHRAPLPSWINPQYNLVLIGDACHPMLPYLAQGANSSIEDGAVLGLLLSSPHFTSKGDLPKALQLFEELRKARGETIAMETWKQRRDFHLPDGEEQEERDRLMVGMLEGALKAGEGYKSRWSSEGEVQRWLWGYDAGTEVQGVTR